MDVQHAEKELQPVRRSFLLLRRDDHRCMRHGEMVLIFQIEFPHRTFNVLSLSVSPSRYFVNSVLSLLRFSPFLSKVSIHCRPRGTDDRLGKLHHTTRKGDYYGAEPSQV